MKGESLIFVVLLLLTSKVSDSKNSTKERMPEPFILDGYNATDGQFPYQVYLIIKGDELCGGSIVSEQYILTAASCIDSARPADIKVVAGTIHYQPQSENEINVIAKHTNGFLESTFAHDIALLKLEKNLTFGENIQSIKLQSSSVPGGTKCIVSGWGKTDDEMGSEDISPVLKFTNLSIVNNEDCARGQWDDYVPPSQVCARSEVGKGACRGDYGGPLACNGYLVGVTSTGLICQNSDRPGEYTNVSYFKEWIEDVINASYVIYPNYAIVFLVNILLFYHFCYL